MRFKNKKGFSLIEAMIAITIMALVLTPMFGLENVILEQVGRLLERYQRLLFAQQYTFTVQQQEESSDVKDLRKEHNEKKPSTRLVYTRKPVDTSSSLAGMKGLYRQEVVASGMRAASSESRIVYFICKPHEVTQ